jgi:hypothetical protein
MGPTQIIRFWAPGGLFMSSGDVNGGFRPFAIDYNRVLGFENGFEKVWMKVWITSHTWVPPIQISTQNESFVQQILPWNKSGGTFV